MDIPLLTRNQSDAMDSILSAMDRGVIIAPWDSKESIVRWKLDGSAFDVPMEAANTIPNDEFIKALYIGWATEGVND
jgi:hypothetical protein